MIDNRLFDAHCHLAPESDGVPASPLPQPSLSGRILCAVEPAGWDAVARAAREWPGTIAGYGVHPWHVTGHPPDGWPDRLEAKLAADPASWLGEAGLDAKRQGIAPADEQEKAFRLQLQIASRLGRAANLHCVGAWDSFIQCLDDDFTGKFIVHGFGGPPQFVRPLTERGGWFTVGPLQVRGKMHRRVAGLPLDRVLLESDGVLEPGRDETETLASCLSWLAEVRGTSAEELIAVISDNVRRMTGHD